MCSLHLSLHRKDLEMKPSILLAFQMQDLTLEVSLRHLEILTNVWSLFLNVIQYRTAKINYNCSKDCRIYAHKDTGRNNKVPGA